MEEIMVSVYCLAYNHERYIRSALEGFVSQKCSFLYEVIIHDDASTDNTAAIIREYEQKYPEVIRPIYQEENQYSKGTGRMVRDFIVPKCRGKYVAVCEGDDYWIDPYKLEKQVAYMEAHPRCTFCFTNGYIENQLKNEERRVFVPYSEEDRAVYVDQCREYTLHNMYEISVCPTASYLMPREAWLTAQSYYKGRCATGDLRMQLYLTALGYAYYMNDKTCVYRENVPGSAVTTWKMESRKKAYSRLEQGLTMLADLDELTCGRYSKGIAVIERRFIRDLLYNATTLQVLKNEKYRTVFDTLSLQKRLKIVVKILLPEWFVVVVKRRKNRKLEK